MLDVTLLRIMKHRKDYFRLRHSVPMASLDQKTQVLLDDFGRYFNKFESHVVIDPQAFAACFATWHPHFDVEVRNLYLGVLRHAGQDVDDDTKAGILGELFELDLGTRLAQIAAEYAAGTLKSPLHQAVGSHLDAYKINVGAKSVTYIDTDIGELLASTTESDGIHWRLKCLREHLRPMRAGDFGILAGRPDKGKTSFLASECTYWAPQLPAHQNVIWLNNEGPGVRIVPRIYQAALGKPLSELREMHACGELVPAYIQAVGRQDRIRVVDIHGFNTAQVTSIFENSNPGIVLFDMIDNIRGFSSQSRTDSQLEEMYQWAREQCVKYSMIGIATSQISNEGDGLQFPTLGMLKDSKTGKQGACDFQLMIGASNEPTMDCFRYLSAPKNKLRREGAIGQLRATVSFNPHISRYEDIPDGV